MTTRTTASARLALPAARLVWATVLFTRSDLLVRAVGSTPDSKTRSVARILAGRHALQAATELLFRPRPGITGTLVDASHALTAAGLASVDRARRPVAIADAAVATTFALADQRRRSAARLSEKGDPR